MAYEPTHEFVSGGTIDPVELNDNFADFAAALSALTNTNLSGSAGITPANLANRYTEFAVKLNMRHHVSAGPTYAVDEYCDFQMLPYDATDGNYSYDIVAVEWVFDPSGAPIAVSPQFDILYGQLTAAPGPDAMTTILTGNISPGVNEAEGTAALAVTTAATANGKPKGFGLRVKAVGTGVVAKDVFSVTIKLKRQLRQ